MSSEPTVTISVKKDNNDKEKEKVLFTLVNGQVKNTRLQSRVSDPDPYPDQVQNFHVFKYRYWMFSFEG
jgi:hypothetical protein